MLRQVGIGGTLALAGTNNPDVSWISENAAWIALFFMCFYICAYAWSWGPLGWLVPSCVSSPTLCSFL